MAEGKPQDTDAAGTPQPPQGQPPQEDAAAQPADVAASAVGAEAPPDRPAGDAATPADPASGEVPQAAGSPVEGAGEPAGEPADRPAEDAGDPAALEATSETSLAPVAEGDSPSLKSEAQDDTATRAGEPDYGVDQYGSEYQGYNQNYDDGSQPAGDEEQDQYDDGKQNVEEEEEGDDEDGDMDELGQRKMTLVEHLEELRMRIIRALIGLVVGMAITLAFGSYIFQILNDPLVKATGKKDILFTIDMTSPLMEYMKVALYVGLVISAPWVFYQVWMFVSAGLYPHERRYVKLAVPFSAGLFILGAVFFLKVVSVPILRFFYFFNTDVMGLDQKVALDKHVTFMTSMMLVFGLCFQMPVAILILAKMGLVTVKSLNHYRRHAIVAILIVAAVLSPSFSPLDQLALAVPMWLLYELGLVLTYFLVEKKRRAAEAAEREEERRRLAEHRRDEEEQEPQEQEQAEEPPVEERHEAEEPDQAEQAQQQVTEP